MQFVLSEDIAGVLKTASPGPHRAFTEKVAPRQRLFGAMSSYEFDSLAALQADSYHLHGLLDVIDNSVDAIDLVYLTGGLSLGGLYQYDQVVNVFDPPDEPETKKFESDNFAQLLLKHCGTLPELLDTFFAKYDEFEKLVKKAKSELSALVRWRLRIVMARIAVLFRRLASADFSSHFAVVHAPFHLLHGAHPPHVAAPVSSIS